MAHSPEDILKFWFGDDLENPLQKAAQWWKKDVAFDREIQETFEEDLKRALRGECDSWKDSPSGSLAWIILTDQFSRNIYRDTPRAFAQDPLALRASLEAQEKGWDCSLSPIRRSFLYMPMMHSEDCSLQQRSVVCFRRLAEEAPLPLKDYFENACEYAVRHAQIVERFGRFPHRNKILGRISTPEEIEFLKQPGASF